jgi:hypothetical protein
MRNRMREIRTSGSVGALGEQSPRATRSMRNIDVLWQQYLELDFVRDRGDYLSSQLYAWTVFDVGQAFQPDDRQPSVRGSGWKA